MLADRLYLRGAVPMSDELSLLLVERLHELRDEGRARLTFVIAVGDGAQTIVGTRQRLPHGVFGARVVETGQQHERAVADVSVGMLADRLQQRGHERGS